MRRVAEPPTDLQALGRWLQLLAGPSRVLILHLLMEGVQCNCALGEALGLPPSLVSHYMRALCNAGLVTVAPDPHDARWTYYSINRPVLETFLRSFDVFFDPQRIKPGCLTGQPEQAARQVLVASGE